MMRNRCLAVGACWLLALLGASRLLGTESLTEASPFLPPGYQSPEDRSPGRQQPTPVRQDPPAQQQFEFRAVAHLRGEWMFNIVDKREGERSWLRLEESIGGLKLRAYDEQREILTVNLANRTETLKLHESQYTATDVPSLRPSPSSGERPPGAPPNYTPPPPPDGAPGSRPPNTIPRRRVVLPNSNQDQNRAGQDGRGTAQATPPNIEELRSRIPDVSQLPQPPEIPPAVRQRMEEIRRQRAQGGSNYGTPTRTPPADPPGNN